MSITDVFLGLIALGVLTTAVLQVVVIVSLIRTAQRGIARLERLRAAVVPLAAYIDAIRGDFTRAHAVAERQFGRIVRVYELVEPSLRYGPAVFAVLRGATALLRRRRR